MKLKLVALALSVIFTGCLDTNGDLDGGGAVSSSVSAGSIQPGAIPSGVTLSASQVSGGVLPPEVLIGDFSQLPAPLDGSCGLNQIMQWNGTDWICIDTPSVTGAPATTVPASGITAGTIGAGVVLPAAQLGAGALPTSVTLSSTSQLPAPLNGTGCAVDQILEWNGSAFVCVNQISESILTDADPATNLSGASEGDVAYDTTDGELQVFNGTAWVPVSSGSAASVPASGITAGTIGAGVVLPASQVGGGTLASGVVLPATQLGAGALPTSVTLSSTSQLPAPLNGTGCAVDQILEWNGSAFVCVDKSASGLEVVATNPTAAGSAAGDVVYNSTENVAFVFDGTDWVPLASSGGSNSVITDVDPATNLSGASEGDVAYDTTDGELQVFNGTAWVPVSSGSSASVPASGITAGTIGAGVVLPATQLGAGALPTSVTLSSTSQLPAPLNGTGCAVDQILEWNGSAFVCVDKSASGLEVVATNPTAAGNTAGDVVYNSTENVAFVFDGTDWVPLASSGGSNSVITDVDPATNLSGASEGDVAYDTTDGELQVFNGTAWVPVSSGSSASVPASGITAGTIGAGVVLPATQLGAGALPTSVTLSSTSQLPAPLNGTGCAVDQILEWNGSAFVCVDQVAESVLTDADPATNLTGASLGDIAYNSTSNELEVFDGTAWAPVSSGSATSVPASGITAGIIGAGVTLPASQVGAGALPASVTLSNISQLPAPLNGTGCTANQILQWNGIVFVCVTPSAGGGGDNLGDHTATQNIDLADSLLVGDGGSAGIAINSSGNVGIGTTTPAVRLDVAGTIGAHNQMIIGLTSSPQPQLNFRELGVSTWNVNSFGGALNFDSPAIGAANRKVTISSAGNVGIGVTAPSYKLEIQGGGLVAPTSATIGGGLLISEADATQSPAIGIYGPGIGFSRASGGNSRRRAGIYSYQTGAGENQNGLAFLTQPAQTPTANSALQHQMTLSHDGNVGIGTTNPGSRLTVVGASDDRNQGIRLSEDSGHNAWIWNNDSTLSLQAGSSGNSDITLNAIGAGNVGIGTPVPSTKLHVQDGVARVEHASSNAILQLESTNTTAPFQSSVVQAYTPLSQWSFGNRSDLNSSSFVISDDDAASIRMLIDNAGNVGIGTTTPTEALEVNGNVLADNVSVPSDIKFKDHRKPLESSLSKIKKLTGYEYVWNKKARKKSGQKAIGVIAQEVEAQFPLLVSVHNKGEEGEYRSVNYQGLVAPIINAIKELDEKGFDQIAEIEALRAENEDLKKRLLRIEQLLQK